MRNYRGQIVKGEIGDLVKGRCNGRTALRVVEFADFYNVIVEETPYRIAEDGFTLIEETPSKEETPRRFSTNTAAILFLKEQEETE